MPEPRRGRPARAARADRRPDLPALRAWPACAWRRRCRRCARATAPWAVGVLLALFAAGAGRCWRCPPGGWPTATATTGRCGSRSALTPLGGVLRRAVDAARRRAHFALLCAAAMLTGAGANIGLIAIQRTAGRMAARQRPSCKRIFSWLGLAPALANVVGPVLAGVLIDAGGFRAAFAVLAAAAAGRAGARRGSVPREAPPPRRRRAGTAGAVVGPAARAGHARACCWSTGCCRRAGTCTPSCCRSSATSAASAPRRSAPSSASSRPRSRRCGCVIPLVAHRLREVAGAASARCWQRRWCSRSIRWCTTRAGDGRLRGAARRGARRGAADDHDDAAPDHARTTATARRSRCARWRSTRRAR